MRSARTAGLIALIGLAGLAKIARLTGIIRLAGLIALIGLAGLASVIGGGCQRAHEPQLFTAFSLDTILTITFYSGDRAENARLAERLFQYAQDVEMRMSTSQRDYQDSELLRSNRRAGDPDGTMVSPDTAAIVAEGIRLSELTEGDFQIGIWPLTRLWDFSLLTETKRLPSDSDIEAALAIVGHDGIHVDRARPAIAFDRPGMGVDVGGIAKGWLGDHFRMELQRAGVQAALIDIGGNILTTGERKGDGTRWKIGIQNPRGDAGEIIGVLSVAERAIVTSGNYERTAIIDERRIHHIIDPATGFPAESGLDSVTIVTTTATRADALSTAVFVKGLQEGWEFVNSLPDVEAVFVTADNTIVITAALYPLFAARSDEFDIKQSP